MGLDRESVSAKPKLRPSLTPEANVPHADGAFRRRRSQSEAMPASQAHSPPPVAPMSSVAPVLIKTLIVVPPNKADTTAGGEWGEGETDGRERERGN